MHVHGAHLNPTNLYSAVEVEKAAAAKQAAEVRKKLLSSASESESEAEAEAQAMSTVGGENEENAPPDQDQMELPAPKKRVLKKDAAEEDNSSDPISIWG